MKSGGTLAFLKVDGAKNRTARRRAERESVR